MNQVSVPIDWVNGGHEDEVACLSTRRGGENALEIRFASAHAPTFHRRRPYGHPLLSWAMHFISESDPCLVEPTALRVKPRPGAVATPSFASPKWRVTDILVIRITGDAAVLWRCRLAPCRPR